MTVTESEPAERAAKAAETARDLAAEAAEAAEEARNAAEEAADTPGGSSAFESSGWNDRAAADIDLSSGGGAESGGPD